jgi:predicted MFS family arabinose efflux permease
LCTFLLALVNEAFRPANSSAIAFYSKPENRTRSYSLNRLAINFGWAVGTSAGGLIASYNYELLFWVDGITNIGAALLLFIFLKPDLQAKLNHVKKNSEAPVTESPYNDKTYLTFIFLVTLFAFCFFQLFTTVPKFYRDEMHLDEKFIGLIMALNGLLIVMIEMVLVYYLEGKRKTLTFVSAGVAICSLAFFCLLIPVNQKLVAISMILLITLGEIISMPFMNTFWTQRSNERSRGQYAALYTMAWGTAQTLGPYICSHLVEATNFKVMFIFLGALLLLSAFGFSKLNRSVSNGAN